MSASWTLRFPGPDAGGCSADHPPHPNPPFQNRRIAGNCFNHPAKWSHVQQMQLKQLLVDEKAVSPVIGVILMVAITVIIGAIVGTFVLGLGDQVQDPAPTVQFNTEYTPDAGGAASDGAVTVTHGGGEEIAAGSMAVKGDGVNVSDGTLWYDLPKSSASESSAMVSAGDDAVVGVTEPSGAGFRLVWQSEDGRSSVLAEWEQ